jgi:hypothetical protein
MTNKFQKIIEELQKSFFFQQFKFRKKDSAFLKKENYGFESIEFQHWDGYDLKRDSRALVLKPLYLKRFDVLHKWFEKYSFKTLADQRNNYSVIFSGETLGMPSEYFFLMDGSDFDQTLEIMKMDIIKNATSVFSKISTLEDLYKYQIIPILENNQSLPNVGADWAFEYLTLARIEGGQSYENLKSIVKKQVEILNDKGEPNIIEYYPKFDEIIEFLERQKFIEK